MSIRCSDTIKRNKHTRCLENFISLGVYLIYNQCTDCKIDTK